MNHGVHHAKNAEYIDANYGGVFIIWDRMFGTYIPERPDIKPVYGTVKPLNSWNPVWANFQVFYQMVQDTINTKKFSNKLKIWYGPTSWRPDDVLEHNPDPDPTRFKEKFNPPLTREQSVFGFFQIFAIVAFAAIVTVTSANQTYQETAIFGLIFITTVIIISLILQNKSNSFNIQLVFSIGLSLFIISGAVVNSSILASQFLVAHALINILYIVIGIPLQRYTFKESIN
jgi:drug/metabolite transporter superfamily protein YnfA